MFSRLRQANLKMKKSKCSLFQWEVAFLGHVVSRDSVCCDPQKIECVANWSVPKSVTDVRSFLGTANYYRRYIQNFAEIAEPLVHVTRKNVSFN